MSVIEPNIALFTFRLTGVTIIMARCLNLSVAQVENAPLEPVEDGRTGETMLRFGVGLDTLAASRGRQVFCKQARRAVHYLFGSSHPPELDAECLYADALFHLHLFPDKSDAADSPDPLAATSDFVATALHRIASQ